ADNDFPVCVNDMLLFFMDIFQAGCAAPLHQNAGRVSPGEDRKIRPLQSRAEIAGRRTGPPAVRDSVIQGAEPFLLGAVEVGGMGKTRLPSGLDPRKVEGSRNAGPRYFQRAIAAVIGIRTG